MVEHHARASRLEIISEGVTSMVVPTSIEVTPLLPKTTMDTVVVAIGALLWDSPQYVLDPMHLDHCVLVFQNIEIAFWEASQSSSQVGCLQDLEAQV